MPADLMKPAPGLADFTGVPKRTGLSRRALLLGISSLLLATETALAVPPPDYPYDSSRLRWSGSSPEQLEFMRRVYKLHLGRASSDPARPFRDNMPSSTLGEVDGSKLLKAAAIQCAELLREARDALLVAQRAGDSQALRTSSIRIGNGYRSAQLQFGLWQANFIRKFSETAKDRSLMAGGPLGSRAAKSMSRTMSKKVAAPGYSWHNSAKAVDFHTTVNGEDLEANSAQIQKWKKSWLFGWLRENASRHAFYLNQQIDEPWHWEWRVE